MGILIFYGIKVALRFASGKGLRVLQPFAPLNIQLYPQSILRAKGIPADPKSASAATGSTKVVFVSP